MKKLITFLLLLSFESKAQYYFPPLTGTTWDTVSPTQLGWCTEYIDSLYTMLDEKKTKAFLVLKDGKIVMEKYFGTFTSDSPWYWASAGKTVTSFLTGIAQQEGILNINDSTSKYLGAGWTSCAPEKERLITVRHQLTMTTGLEFAVPDLDCKTPSCLTYRADAGTQWYYHNAPYLLLSDVISAASGLSYQQYTTSRLSLKTGVSGLWLNGVFYSKPRSMARFGSLIMNKGIWNSDTLMKDTAYFNQMVNTSQELNKSYGYLWWLNGKENYKIPGLNFTFTGSLFPNAPADLIAALGKNDQKLYVWPSKNIVVVRMGESSDLSPVPVVLDTIIWKYLNRIICDPTTQVKTQNTPFASVKIYPNPSTGTLFVESNSENINVSIFTLDGKNVYDTTAKVLVEIPTTTFNNGMYYIRIQSGNETLMKKWVLAR